MTTDVRTLCLLLTTVVTGAVAMAARQPKATVKLTASSDGADRLLVRVRVQDLAGVPRHGGAEVVVAVIEDGLATQVARGENSGRTLRHAAVARSLTTLGGVAASAEDGTADGSLPLSADWSRLHLSLIALLQERDSRRILGAATLRLDTTTARVGGRR